jgi:hypothetical protein
MTEQLLSQVINGELSKKRNNAFTRFAALGLGALLFYNIFPAPPKQALMLTGYIAAFSIWAIEICLAAIDLWLTTLTKQNLKRKPINSSQKILEYYDQHLWVGKNALKAIFLSGTGIMIYWFAGTFFGYWALDGFGSGVILFVFLLTSAVYILGVHFSAKETKLKKTEIQVILDQIKKEQNYPTQIE